MVPIAFDNLEVENDTLLVYSKLPFVYSNNPTTRTVYK